MKDKLGDSAHSDVLRILAGFQWTYLSVALQGVLKLAVIVVLARALTPRDFGLLSFALMCTSFIDRIGQLGVGQALVQAPSLTADSLRTSYILSTTFGILSAAVVALCAPACARFFQEPALVHILYVLALGSIIDGMASFQEARMQRAMRFKELMMVDNLAYAVSMGGFGIVLALLGWGIWSLVIATLVLKILRLLSLVAWRDRQQNVDNGRWSTQEARVLLVTGMGFSLSRVLNFFSLQGDNFIVGRLLGVEALGLYSRAYQLMTIPAMYVGQVFEKVMFPAMAKSQAYPSRLIREYLLALEAITLVASPAAIVIFVLAPEIVRTGFGDAWSGVTPIISILSCGIFFRTAYKCSDTVVRSIGAVYHYAGRQALYTLFVVGGASIGAMTTGLSGVAVGVVAAVALNYVSMTMLCAKMIRVPWQSIARAHLSGIWVSVAVAIGLAGVAPYLRGSVSHPALVLVLGSLWAAIVWGLAALAAHYLMPGGVLEKACNLLSFRGKSLQESHAG
jgi:O-antigen/teichoic acid export membrane protein